MKSAFFSLLLSLVVTSVFSQWGDNFIKLSEVITTETRDITDFDKIKVSEDFVVHIHVSDKAEKVEIEANENLHDLIRVEKNGRTLRIFTDSYSYNYNSKKKNDGAQERLVAHITVKEISEIIGNEDVKIILEDKIYANNLTIKLNEDSTLDGFLEVENLDVRLNEDSILDIQGSAHTMNAIANEDSVIKGYDFTVDKLDIKLNEDSKAKLTVNHEIDLIAREDSYFFYEGHANFTRKTLVEDSEIKPW